MGTAVLQAPLCVLNLPGVKLSTGVLFRGLSMVLYLFRGLRQKTEHPSGCSVFCAEGRDIESCPHMPKGLCMSRRKHWRILCFFRTRSEAGALRRSTLRKNACESQPACHVVADYVSFATAFSFSKQAEHPSGCSAFFLPASFLRFAPGCPPHLHTSSPFSASTVMVDPAARSPRRMVRAIRVSTLLCSTLLRGRAP